MKKLVLVAAIMALGAAQPSAWADNLDFASVDECTTTMQKYFDNAMSQGMYKTGLLFNNIVNGQPSITFSLNPDNKTYTFSESITCHTLFEDSHLKTLWQSTIIPSLNQIVDSLSAKKDLPNVPSAYTMNCSSTTNDFNLQGVQWETCKISS